MPGGVDPLTGRPGGGFLPAIFYRGAETATFGAGSGRFQRAMTYRAHLSSVIAASDGRFCPTIKYRPGETSAWLLAARARRHGVRICGLA